MGGIPSPPIMPWSQPLMTYSEVMKFNASHISSSSSAKNSEKNSSYPREITLEKTLCIVNNIHELLTEFIVEV